MLSIIIWFIQWKAQICIHYILYEGNNNINLLKIAPRPAEAVSNSYNAHKNYKRLQPFSSNLTFSDYFATSCTHNLQYAYSFMHQSLPWENNFHRLSSICRTWKYRFQTRLTKKHTRYGVDRFKVNKLYYDNMPLV